jgi:hypothetical protein
MRFTRVTRAIGNAPDKQISSRRMQFIAKTRLCSEDRPRFETLDHFCQIKIGELINPRFGAFLTYAILKKGKQKVGHKTILIAVKMGNSTAAY